MKLIMLNAFKFSFKESQSLVDHAANVLGGGVKIFLVVDA